MREREYNDIDLSNKGNIAERDNKPFTEMVRRKKEVDTFAESERVQEIFSAQPKAVPKEEIPEIAEKTEKEEKEQKAKKTSKVVSLLASAAAVVVVAVPQIQVAQTNIETANISSYHIETTENSINYEFDFSPNKNMQDQIVSDMDYIEFYKSLEIVVTVYNDFFSDSQPMISEEADYSTYIYYTVEGLKPNMLYYVKVTNHGTLIFQKSITTNGEYYDYYIEGDEPTEEHGYRRTSDGP